MHRTQLTAAKSLGAAPAAGAYWPALVDRQRQTQDGAGENEAGMAAAEPALHDVLHGSLACHL